MMKPKVLLWNLPYKEFALRDFCCSDTPKGSYYWPPIDLLVLSGILNSCFEVSVLDSIVLRQSVNTTLNEVLSFKPDFIIALIGAMTIESDAGILSSVKETLGVPIIGVGDLAFFMPNKTLRDYKVFDALIQNFANGRIVNYLIGDREGLEDIAYRDGNGKIVLAPMTHSTTMSYPMPRHDLFNLSLYNMPYGRYRGISTVISMNGCPWKCSYCNSGQLTYQLRDVDEWIEEISYLKKLGLREFLLHDFTFGPSKGRARKLCEALISKNLCLVWSTEARIDVVGEEELKLMKRAGCYLVKFGIEMADNEKLNKMNRRMKDGAVERGLDLCNRIGIKTLGHFIVGLPGESRESILRTMQYARALNIDYAAINLFVPKIGTPMRQDLLSRQQISENDFRVDVSSDVHEFSAVPPKELAKLYRKGVLSFYLRPTQIWRLLRNSNPSILFENGIAVFRKLLFSVK
jgi:anaerobic magnesium-protoporphyrin IX monomethyl ester cyclase